jgi:hypothetical protein
VDLSSSSLCAQHNVLRFSESFPLARDTLLAKISFSKERLIPSWSPNTRPLWLFDPVSRFQLRNTFLYHNYTAKNLPDATAKAGSGKKRRKAKSNKLAKDDMLSRMIDSEEAATPTPRKHKKKKGRLVPKRVAATPRSGPAFDAHMYDTPLDWRPVYTLRDRETVRDAFARIREVQRPGQI